MYSNSSSKLNYLFLNYFLYIYFENFREISVFQNVLSTSKKWCIFLNISVSPPLSGWCSIASLRKASTRSFWVNPSSTSSSAIASSMVYVELPYSKVVEVCFTLCSPKNEFFSKFSKNLRRSSSFLKSSQNFRNLASFAVFSASQMSFFFCFSCAALSFFSVADHFRKRSSFERMDAVRPKPYLYLRTPFARKTRLGLSPCSMTTMKTTLSRVSQKRSVL